VEEVFGWMKTVGQLRKTRHRGQARVGWILTFTAAAYHLVRMKNLLAAAGARPFSAACHGSSMRALRAVPGRRGACTSAALRSGRHRDARVVARPCVPGGRRTRMANEGEGNKTADREYRREATRFAKSDEAARKAREAAEAIDDEAERAELERAEREAQKGPRS
jgi:hypothetical protein